MVSCITPLMSRLSPVTGLTGSCAVNSIEWRGAHGSPGVALHVQAAVDGVDLAGDVGRFRVGEELHHPGDLIGVTEPADRDLGEDLVQRRHPEARRPVRSYVG